MTEGRAYKTAPETDRTADNVRVIVGVNPTEISSRATHRKIGSDEGVDLRAGMCSGQKAGGDVLGASLTGEHEEHRKGERWEQAWSFSHVFTP